MNYKTLEITQENDVAIVTINRPKALNAINKDVMSELNHLFSTGLTFEDLVGVIITGAGDKAFVAGADITEFDGLDASTGYEHSKIGHDTFRLIETCSVPVIAAINGFSLGGGNELAMACHIRIASENARFGQPEVNLGLIPGYGGTQRLIQFIGKGRAMELLLTGDMIDAETALRYGLVTHVCPSEDLLALAKKILGKISGKGPRAIAKIIETVNAYFDKTADGFELESKEFGIALAGEESTEGVSAFLEKRKADFR